MIIGIPDLPGGFKGLVTSGANALIGFGGAYAINRVFSNQWGIFNQYGVPILLADTVTSVKYQNSSQVASAPVERGTFTSYNKVADPYKASVTMAIGSGSPAKRGAFIAQLDTLSRSTLLFHVVTPDYVHINAAITGYDYAREPQNGARMIVANIHLQEVRMSRVSYETIETRNPEDAPIVSAGEKQLEEVPDSALRRIVEGALDLSDRALESFDRFRTSR